MAGSLAPVMYLAVRTTLCSAIRSRGDETNALDGAAVELSEDLGTHAKSFQSPGAERFCRALFTTVSVCLDQVRLLLMWTPRNLKLSTRSATAPTMSTVTVQPAFSCSPRTAPLSHTHTLNNVGPTHTE